MTGCADTHNTLSPHGWKPVNPIFDTLTLRAEKAFSDTHDTIAARHIIAAMEAEAMANKDSKLIQWRYKYWKARHAMRHGNYDYAISLMQKALHEVDSANYPYDYHRILWNLDFDYHDPSMKLYHSLLHNYNLMHNFGDLPLQADYAMQLGCLLNDIGDFKAGMPYLDIADSLFKAAHLHGQVINNKINRANALRNQGFEKEGGELLRSILSDSIIYTQPDALDLVMGNIYVMLHDTTMLRRAWLLSCKDATLSHSHVIYANYLAEEKCNLNQWDSAQYYHDIASREFNNIDVTDSKIHHFTIAYRIDAHRGQWQNAFHHLKQAANLSDSLHASESRTDISNAALRHAIADEKLNAEINQLTSTFWLSIIIVALLLAGSMVAFIFYRKSRSEAIRSMSLQLDTERAKRRIDAMKLLLKENDNLISSMDSNMARLSESNTITKADISTLQAPLRSHNTTEMLRDDFLDTFGSINPDFPARLRADYPSLTDADIKLCAYLSLGIDNKHIARIMSIRPESVKQARWRLRSKLSLSRTDNLTSFLLRYTQTVSVQNKST